MTSFQTLIQNRQSVRRYANIPVEPEKLELCLEAARLAPSASNSQPWSFIVTQQDPLRTELARATYTDIWLINRFTVQAPVIITIIIEKPRLINRIAMQVKKKEWPLIDIGIAAEHICLQAAELGLGTCMLGWYDEEKVKSLLSIPAQKSVGLMLTLGYPAENYPLRTKIRKTITDIVHWEKY
jgi:nitroreductase